MFFKRKKESGDDILFMLKVLTINTKQIAEISGVLVGMDEAIGDLKTRIEKLEHKKGAKNVRKQKTKKRN